MPEGTIAPTGTPGRLQGVRELEDYLKGLIDRARREKGDDMISLLVNGGTEEDHLSDNEVAALCALILFAGHETTTNLLCNSLVTLDRNPDQFELLQVDPAFVDRPSRRCCGTRARSRS